MPGPALVPAETISLISRLTFIAEQPRSLRVEAEETAKPENKQIGEGRHDDRLQISIAR
jgi:hypothetical protein